MSSDNQFTALGPTIIGFQTNGSRIQRGAEISGNEVGVSGYCDAGYGVLGTSKTDVGVYGTSESIAGVVGKGTPGVVGQGPGSIKTVDVVVLSSYKAGVMGLAEDKNGVGVYGLNSSLSEGGPSLGGVGVAGISKNGHGVFGYSQDCGVLGECYRSFESDVEDRAPVGAGVLGLGDGVAGVVGLSRRYGVMGVLGPTSLDRTKIPTSKFSDIGDLASPAAVVGNANYERAGIGVFGVSVDSSGVHGWSSSGAGVIGNSKSGRGGIFQSGLGIDRSEHNRLVAQVWLIPRPMNVTKSVPVAPVMFDSLGLDSLPVDGQPGDILVTKDKDGVATLWFCVRENSFEHASWCQILLGTPVPGRG